MEKMEKIRLGKIDPKTILDNLSIQLDDSKLLETNKSQDNLNQSKAIKTVQDAT